MLALRILVPTALVVLCTFLPFLPGRYDELAIALSQMGQLAGLVGVLLVPAGALWLVLDARRRATGSLRRRDRSAAVVLLVSAFAGLLVALSAGVFSGFSLAIAAVVLWGYLVARGASHLTRTPAGPRLARSTAVSLMIVPLAVLALQLSLAERVSQWSRARAIRNSGQMIADIEAYREAHGRYPASLLGLWPDYLPGTIGVREYRYEPSGDAYNLVFEHPSLRFGTRELVVYNPRGEQVATSHTMDLLEFGGQALELRRGFFAVREASVPGWKYFLFD